MIKPSSIKYRLLVNILLVIVLLSSAIIATTYFGNRHSLQKLSATLIKQTLETTKSKLSSFFRPVITELMLTRTWGETGLLDTDDPLRLRQLLVPVMRQHSQISSLMIADSRGREFMLHRSEHNWINRITKRDIWGSRISWYRWSEQQQLRPRHVWKFMDYDPRDRPWYTGALNEVKRLSPAGQMSFARLDPMLSLHWTQPYTFYTSKEPGISASIVYTSKDKHKKVIGFDVLLTDISKFTTSLKVSENGKVIVLTDDSRIIGLPRSKRYLDPIKIRRDLLKKPNQLDNKLIADALSAYLSRSAKQHRFGDFTDDTQAESGPAQFKSGKQVWYAEFRRFPLSEKRSLLIAALIPEKDLLGDLSDLRIWIVVLTLTVMTIAIFRSVYLARKFSEPIEILMKQSERISRGSLYQGAAVESSIVEVQRLADAHEKMRVALKSLLKMERDLQLARQIQQNTFPAKLPELIDFDLHTWSQPADETGGDTYDVIGFNLAENGEVELNSKQSDYCFIMMADATGHGIGPALSANEVRAMLRMAVRTGESLDNIAKHINAQLYNDLHAGRFITACLCYIDVRAGKLNYFSAGQAPIIHFRAQQSDFDIQSADAPPLGVMSDLGIKINTDVELLPGDIFALMSDGVFEAVNAEKEQFGLDRVLSILKNNQQKKCAEIMLELHSALNLFTRDVPANDDKTVILIKRNLGN